MAIDFLLHFSVSAQNVHLSTPQINTQVLLNRTVLTVEEVKKKKKKAILFYRRQTEAQRG